MAQYITDLKVSLNEMEESDYQAHGYTKLPGDLKEGIRGKKAYLWYKKGSKNAITRIQFTFHDSMTAGLSKAGYHKIDKNLNEGTSGDTIYLWYHRGSSKYDIPITDLDVALDAEAEAAKYKAGWQRLACDLNRKAGGNWVYLFVKREKPVYICDITASADFGQDLDHVQKGYIRVDEDTNRRAGGTYVFIWYRLTTDPVQAIKRPLQVSLNDNEYQNYQSQGYTPVKQNLNEGNEGNRIFLWYMKHVPENPITDVSVIVNPDVDPFVNAGVNVIKKDLNTGTRGDSEFVCFTESQG